MLLASGVACSSIGAIRLGLEEISEPWGNTYPLLSSGARIEVRRGPRPPPTSGTSVLRRDITHATVPLDPDGPVPLEVHARYTRREIQAAFGDGGSLIPPRWDSGVKWLADSKIDLFAFTLDKSSGDLSPTTRHRDYAISRDLIHWESQSARSPSPGDWSTACPLISSRSSQRQPSRSWRDLATPSARDSFLSVTHRQGPNVETAVPQAARQVPRSPFRSRTIR